METVNISPDPDVCLAVLLEILRMDHENRYLTDKARAEIWYHIEKLLGISFEDNIGRIPNA